MSPHLALVAVSVAYVLAIVLQTPQSMSLTYDEVVYASQVARDAPPAEFSAPRARGMSLLIAPVVMITETPLALRSYLVVLAGLAMYLAFRPWLSVFGRIGERYRYVPATAAGVFATLWITVIYGNLAYPNLWLTFALVAGAGYLVRAATESPPGRRSLVGVTVAFAAASMLRPTDATAVAAPLLVALVLVPGWRRLSALIAVGGGLAIGWGAWVAEAYVGFGGPLERLKRGGEINESGLTNSIMENLAALDGPRVLCRPASQCAGIEPAATVWWLLLPVLVAMGLFVAARSGWLTTGLVTAAAATAPAIAYLFLIDYAAPRFLLPTYGLLALLVAMALIWITDRATARSRLIANAIMIVGLLGHLAIQVKVLERAQDRLEVVAAGNDTFARFLRDEGFQAPCVVWGGNAVPVGYQLGCESIPTFSDSARPEDHQTAILQAIEQGKSVAIRLPEDAEPPTFLEGWRRLELPRGSSYVVYLPPGAGP